MSTELIERLRRMAGDYALVQREKANEPGRVYSWDNVEKSCWEAANALEAAEAELTRRDTEVAAKALEAEAQRLEDMVSGYGNRESGQLMAGRDIIRQIRARAAVLAAAPVSLEAVKAETTTEWGVRWTQVDPPAVTDRGADEVDIRRLVQAFPAVSEAVVREVTEWRPVADLQEHGYPQETKHEEGQ